MRLDSRLSFAGAWRIVAVLCEVSGELPELLSNDEFRAFFSDQEKIEGKLAIVELTASSCRWPSGNPREPTTFRYCGAPISRRSYCERHARLAYPPRAA